MIEWLGWRHACFAYAALLLCCVFPAYLFALPAGGGKSTGRSPRAKGRKRAAGTSVLAAVRHFHPRVGDYDRYLGTTDRATAGAGLHASWRAGRQRGAGAMPVASRVVDIAFKRGHPIWTALFSVGLVALGLVMLTLFPYLAIVSMLIYGAGNGLRAIVRGTLPLVLVNAEDYALITGRMARPALIGRH